MAGKRGPARKPGNWLTRLLSRRPGLPPEIRAAMQLIESVDAGGIPLYPVKVNAIARDLGLEVSAKAPVEDTIRRIRAALERA